MKVYKIYTIKDGYYELLYEDVKESNINFVVQEVLKSGVLPKDIIISNGRDLNHRKMEIIEGEI